MNNQQFFEKVSQMRKQQKTYQEAKPSSQESRDALIASKRLETEIDQPGDSESAGNPCQERHLPGSV